MKKDYTHITVILDRTGSMESIRDDVIGGFNAFLKEQKTIPHEATMTLVQFDTQDPYEVLHHVKPLAQIPELTAETYVPRASTPLLDAIGRGINDLNAHIARMAESSKPEQVVFVIITDGQENSSREFTREQIAKMVKDNEVNNKWQFVFLSADFAAFSDASDYGMSDSKRAYFSKNSVNTGVCFRLSSAIISNYRNKTASGVEFNEDDKNAMVDKDDKAGK